MLQICYFGNTCIEQGIKLNEISVVLTTHLQIVLHII